MTLHDMLMGMRLRKVTPRDLNLPKPMPSPLTPPEPARALPMPHQAEEDYLGFLRKFPVPHAGAKNALQEGVRKMFTRRGGHGK